MISPTLTSEVQLGVLLPLPLLDGALDGQGQLDADTLHARLDLVQMLLAEVLHRVSHGEGFKHGHSVLVNITRSLREVSSVRVTNGRHIVRSPPETGQRIGECASGYVVASRGHNA